MSSLVAPAVSNSVIWSTSAHPGSPHGSMTSISSKSTTGRFVPGWLTGVHGTMCFCPESATAANQEVACCLRRNSRISGFFPLFSFRYSPSTSNRCEYARIVSGGLPLMTNTHAEQTWEDSGERTLFWPTKLEPCQSLMRNPDKLVAPHTQHGSLGCGPTPSHAGLPSRSHSNWLADFTTWAL